MEKKPTLCKICKNIKTRILDGKFDNINKRWVDDSGGIWNGKICPPCQLLKVREKMRGIPRKRYNYIKTDKYSNMSEEEIIQIKEKNRERNRKYMTKRHKEDINFRLAHNLRSRLYNAIKRDQKVGSAIKDLGCSIDELKIYIESKFIDNMSWENYGEWEIDHIIALSTVNLMNREEFLKVNHYSNLQPMWKIPNIQKGNK